MSKEIQKGVLFGIFFNYKRINEIITHISEYMRHIDKFHKK